MKKILIYCFIISPLFGLAQMEIDKKPTQTKGIFMGVDLLNPALSFFTDKKGFEAVVAVPFKQKWNIVAEIGYEQNHFENNVWNVDAEGLYTRIGANWFLSHDNQNPNMGYYLGGRIGYSPFQQNIHQYVIQGIDIPPITGSLPQHNAHAVWIEPLAGGRVQLFNTAFYIDANVRLKVKVFDSNEENMTPLIIPGFGTNNNGLNFGVNWSIGYILSL